MKNLAPDIFRQRLLMEGFHRADLTREDVERFLLCLAAHLDLKTYGDAVVFSPSPGTGRDDNAGFDGFVPLIDSGISIYVWRRQRFFSVLLYTCKGFEEKEAIEFTRAFLHVDGEMACRSF
jgi:S-adenosylmethionine decarboxylase